MAKITDNSLLLVQSASEINNIRAKDLKLYTSPLAKQPNMFTKERGVAGLMFPSEDFYYNPGTGELSLKESGYSEREVGFIGYKENFFGNPMLEYMTLVPSMTGTELAGDYYTVVDPEYKYLTNDWGTAYYVPGTTEIQRVFVGDKIKKRSDISGDWEYSPGVGGSIYMVKKVTDYAHISEITP